MIYCDQCSKVWVHKICIKNIVPEETKQINKKKMPENNHRTGNSLKVLWPYVQQKLLWHNYSSRNHQETLNMYSVMIYLSYISNSDQPMTQIQIKKHGTSNREQNGNIYIKGFLPDQNSRDLLISIAHGWKVKMILSIL